MAVGVILMAILGAIGNKLIQEARTEMAAKSKDEIKEDIKSSRDSIKNEILRETQKLKDGQVEINKGIGDIAKELESKETFNINLNQYAVFSKANQLQIHIKIQNNSNISGTDPKLRLEVYSKEFKGIAQPSLIDYKNFNRRGEDGESYQINPNLDFRYYFNFHYTTNKNFAQKTLYPQDNVSFTATTRPIKELSSIRYIILQTDCWFKESKRVTKFSLLDISIPNKGKTIMESGETELPTLVEYYNKLLFDD